MKDNCYAYAMDLSLCKGQDGDYSEPLVFECQPLISSNLGGNSGWNYKNAFNKAFPNANITIDIQGRKTKIVLSNPKFDMLIKNSESVSRDEFLKIKHNEYTHVHTGSFETEIDKLNNKVLQRLYLPDEISPEYRILQANAAPEKLAKDISNYFIAKGISKIVLKSAINHEGKGNIFTDIEDKEEFEQAIVKICELNAETKYFLAEEQKEFPRISRKTGEKKTDHLSYRLVGIANQEGDLGHFIASKSISDSLDSHQRGKMKCYFNESGKTHQSKTGWQLKACGPKDKYFGIGEKKIDIHPALMDKISKQIYQLYTDIKSMTDEEFELHVDSLVERKNALASREEKIDAFVIEKKQKNELVNTPNLLAFSRSSAAHPQLAASIANKMVTTNTVDLAELAKLSCYNNEDIKPFLNAMRNQNKFDGLKTANTDQLNYCIEKASQDMHIPKIAKLLIENNRQSAQADPVQPKAGASSNCGSRLQHAFFSNNVLFGIKTEATNPANKETVGNNSANFTPRLAGLSTFTIPKGESNKYAEEENEQKKSRFTRKLVN